MEMAEAKKSEEHNKAIVEGTQLSERKRSFSTKEDRKVEPTNKTAVNRKEVNKEVRRMKKFKKIGGRVKVDSLAKVSKKSMKSFKSATSLKGKSATFPDSHENIINEDDKGFKEHITNLLTTMKSLKGSNASPALDILRKSKAQIIEEIAPNEEDEEDKETPVKTVKKRHQSKKEKKKKKKFKKKEFIKEMKATEEQLENFRKEREQMEIDRKKMLSYWNNIADRIAKAETMRNNLRKKFESLKFDDKFGLWELARNDRNSFFSNYNIELNKIKIICIKTLNGIIKDLDRKQLEFQKDIFDHNRERFKIAQDLLSFTFSGWKLIAEEFSQMVLDMEPSLKIKSHVLIKENNKELKSLTTSIHSQFRVIENERMLKLEQSFKDNYSALHLDLKQFSTRLQPSKSLINSLSVKLAKNLILYNHKKNEWQNTNKLYNDLTERSKFSQEKCRLLKQTAEFSKKMKKKIRKIIKKNKRLLTIKQFCLVCKYSGKEILRKFTERLTRETKELEEFHFKTKKDYFKSIICSMDLAKATMLHIMQLTDVTKHFGFSECYENDNKVRILGTNEYNFPKERAKIQLKNTMPKSQEFLHQMCIIARELYHCTVNIINRQMSKIYLNKDDLVVKRNRSKLISMGRIEEYEKLALSLMREGREKSPKHLV